MLVFSTGFMNYCPSNLLSGYLLPLPPSLCELMYFINVYSVLRGGGVIGGEGPQTDKRPAAKYLYMLII